ncbi:MAG: phenylacetate-CoA oxygenase subunit PaaC [Gammaproteobacteria bacterium]|nr:phenylacetate-CoA oxygenase subunit PaaC [Gammaproteobacteria bacterium]
MDRERLSEYLLRLADNALISGQQLAAWVGHGPELEEEMAMANFALDYIGQARMLYTYAGEVEGKGRSEDELAFLRDGMDFRNVLLVEQPNGDFAQTIARQFLYESWYLPLLEALAISTDRRLAEIAACAVREIRYHLRHARMWLVRLGDGTDESRQRMQTAIDLLWPCTGELFAADAIDEWAAETGLGPHPGSLRPAWDAKVGAAIEEATLKRPVSDWVARGGRRGRHTEHLGYLLAEMQFLQRAYLAANW